MRRDYFTCVFLGLIAGALAFVFFSPLYFTFDGIVPRDFPILERFMSFLYAVFFIFFLPFFAAFRKKEWVNWGLAAYGFLIYLPLWFYPAEKLAMENPGLTTKLGLNALMKTRDASYDCSNLTGTKLGVLTTDETGSLLEEIILQRRIELWGEYGRIYDIKRLRQGFVRTTAMGHPSAALMTSLHLDDPESFDWVLTIPQKEFDANDYMVQNPINSYASGDQGDDPALTPTVKEK